MVNFLNKIKQKSTSGLSVYKYIYSIKNYKGGECDLEYKNHPVNPDHGQLGWARQLHRARQAEHEERNNPTSKLGKLFKKKKKDKADTSTENALQKIENIKTEEEVKWQLITAN